MKYIDSADRDYAPRWIAWARKRYAPSALFVDLMDYHRAACLATWARSKPARRARRMIEQCLGGKYAKAIVLYYDDALAREQTTRDARRMPGIAKRMGREIAHRMDSRTEAAQKLMEGALL